MEPNKIKNVALYLRVSTEEQAKDGYGLDTQLEKLKAFVTLNNYILHKNHIYTDEGFSGTLPIEKRPALNRLLNDAQEGYFKLVIVYKVDRLARDNFITIGCVRRLNELGIDFCSATEPFDTSNAFGNFMLQFLGASAEMDRKNILERTQNGRILAAKAGKWVMGSPPYGYRLDKETKSLKLDKKQAKWIKKFFEWLVYERCSVRSIAQRANDFKIPTKLQVDNSKRKSRGVWWPRTIGRMFINEIYTGTIYLKRYNRGAKDLNTLNKVKYMRKKEEWIPFEVPQIISKDLFDKAVQQLKKNSEFAKRNSKHTYMFSGLINCSKCGYKMRGQFSKPKSKTATGSRFYYGYIPKSRRGHSKRCDYCGVVPETRLMLIWDSLKTILTNPEIVYKKLKHYTGQSKTNRLGSKAVVLDNRLRSLQQEKERLHKAFLDIGAIDEKEYRSRLKKNGNRQEEVLREKRKLKDVLISEKERSERVEIIQNLYRKLKKDLEKASYETAAKILHLFVNRIDLDLATNTAKVEFNFSNYPDIMKDNRSDSCPSKIFSIFAKIPVISSKRLKRLITQDDRNSTCDQ